MHGRPSQTGGKSSVNEFYYDHFVSLSSVLNRVNATGDIIHVHVLGRPIVILNSLESVREILEKHSANNSDRPRFVYFQELYAFMIFLLLRCFF